MTPRELDALARAAVTLDLEAAHDRMLDEKLHRMVRGEYGLAQEADDIAHRIARAHTAERMDPEPAPPCVCAMCRAVMPV